MTQVLHVFRHQWADFWRRGIVLAMALSVGLVGIASVLLEWQAWHQEDATRQAMQAQERSQWLALEDTHIHKAAHRGYFVIRDMSVGVVLDRGVWDFGGSAIWLEAHRRNAPLLRAADDAGILARAVPRGVGPVCLWLVPLLIAVLAHGVFASERAQGSLAFAISSGAPPGTLVLGKSLATIALAWAGALLPLGLGMAIALANGQEAAPTAVWLVATLAALVLFAVGTVIVSALCTRPFQALIALLLIWFVFVVVWPRLAADLTGQLLPLPSSQTVRVEAEVASEGLVSDESKDLVRTMLATKGVTSPNSGGVSAMAAEIDAAAAFKRIFAPLEEGKQNQARLLDVLSWLSPIGAADRLGDSVLHLSDHDQAVFEARAEAMRFATQMALNEGWAEQTKSARGDAVLWQKVIDAADKATVQRPPKSLAWGGLVLWGFISVWGLISARSVIARSAV